MNNLDHVYQRHSARGACRLHGFAMKFPKLTLLLAIVGGIGPALVNWPMSMALAAGGTVEFSFNESVGTTAADASGNGNTGTVLNGAGWVAGKLGNALSFDGSNDHVMIPSSPSLNDVSAGITVAGWVYREATRSGWTTLVSRPIGTGYTEHFFLGLNGTSYRWFVNTSGGGYSNATLGEASPLGVWEHVTGTYDGSTVRFYVNGVQRFSASHSGPLMSDTSPVTIGASYNDPSRTAGEAFKGNIDEFELHGGALGAAEVQDLYASGGVPVTPPSVSITSPLQDATFTDTVTISASATANTGIGGVQFKLDGINIGAEDTTLDNTTASISLDTAGYENGSHSLTAVVRDTEGFTSTSAVVVVTFKNELILRLGKVMPLGDSITNGFVSPGDGSNEDGGYRRFVWERLVANGLNGATNLVGSLQTGIASIDRDHEGHNGWRTDQIQAGIVSWLNTFQPDTILLQIGTNDLVQGATPADTLNRLASLLDTIFATRPSVRVLVAGLLCSRVNNDYPTFLSADVTTYNAGIPPLVNARAAAGKAISYVDPAQAGLNTSSTSPDYGADGLHPSPTGYNKMSNMWYSALTSN